MNKNNVHHWFQLPEQDRKDIFTEAARRKIYM